MDQVKEILKQLIHYRFWIAVGVSCLLPVAAYVVGAAPIQEQAKTAEAAITSAANGVKTYTSGKPVNKQYAEQVSAKTADLTKDVDQSWKELYERQAPLLTWPERVHERFTAWGRKWPENTDASAVQIAIIDYMNAYPGFVTEVYDSFKPFRYDEGTGVVAAPPEKTLLRPSTFDEQAPPGLGKVWSAQERLWIQRTLLDVVAKVNKNAKGWDSAIIKQINALEVGNSAAQDQQSLAKGEVLEEAPDIVDPAAPPPAEAPAASSSGSGSAASAAMANVGSGMGGSGGGTGENPESIYYIKSESPAFKILPVMMTVLIDQDSIPDFLIALENSPMNIQVKDFEMSKPLARVSKPDKGVQMSYGMGMMGGSGMIMSPGSMTGYGGARMAAMQAMMNSGAGSPNSLLGPAGKARPDRKGVDKRAGEGREKSAADALKAAKGATVVSLHDPYYNIVEVKVYGQARFFNPPPAPPAAEPSQSADAAAPDASPDAAAKKDADTPEAGADMADAKKDEGMKKEEGAEKEEGKKKDEGAKADAKKDEPKAEAKKSDEPKPDAKKAEPKKSDEPKDDAKKAAPDAK